MRPASSEKEREFLKPLSSKRRRRRKEFVAIDLESKDGDSQSPGFTRPFLVGMYDPKKEEYQEFRDEPHLRSRPWDERHALPGGCVDKLLSVALTRRYRGKIFYAHNGGSFDWLFLLAWLERHRDEYGFEIIPVQSSIQVLRVWKKVKESEEKKKSKKKPAKLSWEFLDSMKLLPMGLDRAAKTFGIEGKRKHELGLHEDDPSWSEYLKQDCVTLATVMRRLYDLVERLGGEVGITTPSTAMRLFRRRFLGRNGTPRRVARWRHWDDCKDPKRCGGCAHRWYRRGYYGGRTEIFWTELKNGKYSDINSSYVAAMRQPMPVGDRFVDEGRLDWRRHPSRGGRYGGFAECTVYVPPECPIPPLPHRDGKTGKLLFPTGRFHGVWDVDELRLLDDPLVGGRIEHVTRTVWFRLKDLFRDMVDTLWGFRAPQCSECGEGMQARGDKSPCEHFDEGLSALAKLIGNGAYGKFCMKNERTSIVFENEHEKRKGRCFLCGESAPSLGEDTFAAMCEACEGSKPASGEPDGIVWYQRKHVDAPYIIPQIGAHVTALARIKLWEYMRLAITTPGRTIATDDVMVGDVLFTVKGRPALVRQIRGNRGTGRFDVRVDEGEGRGASTTLDVEAEEVQVGGIVAYTDTDSILSDVTLPTGTRLGELKDEYPGERLDFLAVQPKVYLLDRKTLADRAEGPVRGRTKITAKGFPPELRTVENLETLRRGGVLRTLPLPPGTSEGPPEPWRRLEKVRSLARAGFRRSPRMVDVEKSFRTTYDKRVVLEDGIRTRAIVLDEPIGGFACAVSPSLEACFPIPSDERRSRRQPLPEA
jgi:hypothetical protein